MKKSGVITILILTLLIALSIVLFGFVFCVRKQTVIFNGELAITEQEIISTANIENGSPTLLLNKEEAINNIEKKYPHVKVVQIKTTSLTEIEIVVRERYPLFYFENGEKFYMLDEELKVLNIATEEPTNLIKIINISNMENVKKNSDFVGTSKEQEVYTNLFISTYSAVLTTEDYKQARADMANIIFSVCYENDKLTIKTKDEVTIEIAKPDVDLTSKINICFAAIKQLTEEQKSKTTIKILYNADETEFNGYIEILD